MEIIDQIESVVDQFLNDEANRHDLAYRSSYQLEFSADMDRRTAELLEDIIYDWFGNRRLTGEVYIGDDMSGEFEYMIQIEIR